MKYFREKGRKGNRYHCLDRGKSGLRRREYQRKTGGCKATESATENIPLFVDNE